jgi:hypothetical protein
MSITGLEIFDTTRYKIHSWKCERSVWCFPFCIHSYQAGGVKWRSILCRRDSRRRR